MKKLVFLLLLNLSFSSKAQSLIQSVNSGSIIASNSMVSVGEIIIGWLLLRQADIAIARSANPGRDADFYAGKIESAKFFIRTVLPHISAEKAILESEDGGLMNISEAAF